MSDALDFLPMLPLWYAAFLLSTTAHEAAHALAARLGGDDTAYLGGQVSLNPLPHIRREPFGTVLVPLLTFFLYGGGWMIGWASAPYDPAWEDRHPRRAAWMALAGPAANVALAAIAFVVLVAGMNAGSWTPPWDASFERLVLPSPGAPAVLDGLGRFLSVLFGLNLLLAVFNMIPVFPLDGASVLAGLAPPARRLRDWMRSNPMGVLIGIVIAWKLIPYVFRPVYTAAAHLLYRLGT